MKKSIYDEAIRIVLLGFLLLSGGLQLILYSLDCLFRQSSSGFESRLFFGEEFLPLQVNAFWGIYLMVLVVLLGIKWVQSSFGGEPKMTEKAVKYGNLPDGLRFSMRMNGLIFVDSLLKFVLPFVVYLVRGDFVSFKRLFLFSDGIFGIYNKLWVILLPIFLFTILPQYKKAFNELQR